MASYIVTNLAIFLSCLFTISLLVNAPARLKFYMYIASLASWLVPWSAVYTWVKTVLIGSAVQSSSLHISKYSLDYWLFEFEFYLQNLTSFTLNDLLWAMFIMTMIGILWFTLDFKQAYHFHQSRMKHSKPINEALITNCFNPKKIEIRVGNFASPGAITGFLKPKIWIDDSINCTDKLTLVVLHELNHIQQKDHLWMWWLAFMQRVFCWNPIVQFCIRHCKVELELSCDEKCNLELPEKTYAMGLASILMSHAKNQKDQKFTLLNIKHSKKLNVKRIERLMVNCRLKLWHRFTCLLGIFLCISSVATIAIASPVTNTSPSQNQLQKVLNDKSHENCQDIPQPPASLTPL